MSMALTFRMGPVQISIKPIESVYEISYLMATAIFILGLYVTVCEIITFELPICSSFGTLFLKMNFKYVEDLDEN